MLEPLLSSARCNPNKEGHLLSETEGQLYLQRPCSPSPCLFLSTSFLSRITGSLVFLKFLAEDIVQELKSLCSALGLLQTGEEEGHPGESRAVQVLAS